MALQFAEISKSTVCIRQKKKKERKNIETKETMQTKYFLLWNAIMDSYFQFQNKLSKSALNPKRFHP